MGRLPIHAVCWLTVGKRARRGEAWQDERPCRYSVAKTPSRTRTDDTPTGAIFFSTTEDSPVDHDARSVSLASSNCVPLVPVFDQQMVFAKSRICVTHHNCDWSGRQPTALCTRANFTTWECMTDKVHDPSQPKNLMLSGVF